MFDTNRNIAIYLHTADESCRQLNRFFSILRRYGAIDIRDQDIARHHYDCLYGEVCYYLLYVYNTDYAVNRKDPDDLALMVAWMCCLNITV